MLFQLISSLCLLWTCYQGVLSEENFKKWPSNLQRCSINDPALNECILQAAKHAIPKLVKGSKELGLVSLDPMRMGNFTLTASKGPISLRIDMAEAQLAGQSLINLKSVKYDKEKFRLEMEGLHRDIQLTGYYTTKGKLFRVPVNSKGTLLFNLRNMDATHVVQFKPSSDDSLTFLDLDVIFKINHVDLFKMDMYNPSATRFSGATLNKLLNDNWRTVLSAFTPSMENIVQKVFTEAFRPMFLNIPYQEILPTYKIV